MSEKENPLGYRWSSGCRDSLKMSPCNSFEMSPLPVACRKAGGPDGEPRDEHKGTTTHDVNDTGQGRLAKVTVGGPDDAGILPAGEADLAAFPAGRRRRARAPQSWASITPLASGGRTAAGGGFVPPVLRRVRAGAGE